MYYMYDLRTEVRDLRGFGTSIRLVVRAGILMSVGNFLEDLSQQIICVHINAHRALMFIVLFVTAVRFLLLIMCSADYVR